MITLKLPAARSVRALMLALAVTACADKNVPLVPGAASGRGLAAAPPNGTRPTLLHREMTSGPVASASPSQMLRGPAVVSRAKDATTATATAFATAAPSLVWQNHKPASAGSGR